MNKIAAYLLFSTFVSLAGCAQYGPYRTSPTLCEGSTTACTTSMLYRHKEAGQAKFDYSLGFVEFNDQGDPWPASGSQQQMAVVLGYLERQAADQDLLMVVFVHGWHHSAKGQEPGAPSSHEDERDGNVKTFQTVLQGLALAEGKQAKALNRAPREIAGIYVGWRGDSITAEPLNDLTFWDRKNTAAQVGHGGVTELLSRIELIKRTQDSKARDAAAKPASLGATTVPATGCERLIASGQAITSQTKLVVVGHSFGGLVVQSAVGQILEDRAVRTKGGDYGCQLDVEGFGNLVVLINPAFEAQRYSVIHNLAAARKFYPAQQLPVELILTSQSDDATKYLFPAGRHVSTLFDRNGWDAQNITAVGHYKPYITHTLTRSATVPDITLKQAWLNNAKPDRDLCVAGLTLTREQLSERNPYLNVSVAGDLIKGHNDIDEPQITEIIKQVILLSTLTDKDRQDAVADIDPGCTLGNRAGEKPAVNPAQSGE
ncbi:MAG: Esterase [Pseudomonas sp.]|nr:Esterase [Pseudomonas sp.]